MKDLIKGGIFGSLRSRTDREIKNHRKTNTAILGTRPSFLARALHKFLDERKILRFLTVYIVLLILIIVIEIIINAVHPVSALSSPDSSHLRPLLKDLTSYFLGAQTVMIGLLFPIAVGLVTLIVQREGASSTIADVQVYYSESLAYGIGASGIALSIVLAIQLAWPAHFMIHFFGLANPGDFSKILLTVLHLFWLIINFTGLWHFLTTSLSFVRPTERARFRRHFAANVSIARDLSARLFQKLYFNAEASMLSEARETQVSEARPIQFGSSGEWGDVEVADPNLSGKFVYDVWLKPLSWAARRWLKRCDEQLRNNRQRRDAILLMFTASLGHPLSEGGVLCRRVNGLPLSKLERLIIRRCFRLRRRTQESKVLKEHAGPSEMLEELADKAIGHMDRLAVTSFKTALDEMIDFHHFLIDAYATTSEAGTAASYAQVGGFFAPHEEWIRQYLRLFERATEYITREDDFVRTLLRVPYRLLPTDGRHAASAVTVGLLDLGYIFVNRLEAWLTRRRFYAPNQAEGQPLMPRLAGSDKQAYEEVIRDFIGAWETIRPVVASIYRWRNTEIEPDEQWRRYCESWMILQRHLRNTTYMLAVAVWNEDKIGADHYCDMLLHWFDGFRHQFDDDYYLFDGLVTRDLLDKEWQDAQKMLCHPKTHRPAPASVFSAILRSMMDDAIFIISGIMLGWFVGRQQNSDIAPRIVYRLMTDSVQDDGAHRVKRETGFHPIMTSFLRMSAFSNGPYGDWLDNFFEFLARISETPKVAYRVYVSFIPNRCEHLMVPWLSGLLAFLPPEGDAGAVHTIARLIEREEAFPEGDASLEELLRCFRRAKAVLASDRKKDLERGSLALQPDAPIDERIGRLASIFDQIVTAIEAQRRERLRSRPVD